MVLVEGLPMPKAAKKRPTPKMHSGNTKKSPLDGPEPPHPQARTTARIGGSPPEPRRESDGTGKLKTVGIGERIRDGIGEQIGQGKGSGSAAVLAGKQGPNQRQKKLSGSKTPPEPELPALGLTCSSISALAGCKTQTAGIQSGGLNLAQWLAAVVFLSSSMGCFHSMCP